MTGVSSGGQQRQLAKAGLGLFQQQGLDTRKCTTRMKGCRDAEMCCRQMQAPQLLLKMIAGALLQQAVSQQRQAQAWQRSQAAQPALSAAPQAAAPAPAPVAGLVGTGHPGWLRRLQTCLWWLSGLAATTP